MTSIAKRKRMKRGRGKRIRVGSKEHTGEMEIAPGWVVLDGHQEDPGSGSTERQH